MKWPTATLAEVATIERRVVAPADIVDGTFYLGLEDIERGGAIPRPRVIGATKVNSIKFTFTNEHILFGKLRPNLGKVARPWFDGVCSTDILPVLPGKDLNRSFLWHFLKQPTMIDFASSRTSGANLPRLSPTSLSAFPIPLPPLEVQRRIAAILDQADALGARRRRVLAYLDNLTQSIFHEMFEDQPWDMTLGDYADVQIGPFGSLLHRDDYIRGGVEVLNPMHIRDGELRPDPDFSVSTEKAASLSRYRVLEGDVLLGRRGEMGRAGVVRESHAGMLCGTGSLILRPTSVQSVFLHAVVTSPRMKVHLTRNALGATLLNLNAGIVKSSASPNATIEMQQAFAARIERVNRQRLATMSGSVLCNKLFASLQARAFSGRL